MKVRKGLLKGAKGSLGLISRGLSLSEKTLFPVGGKNRGHGQYGAWTDFIQEPFTGAWQRNMEINQEDMTRNFAVFACMSLISGDISKLPFVFKEQSGTYWKLVQKSEYSWLQKRPNHFQTPSQFREQWLLSKLQNGNTYALKRRDAMGKVIQLFILDPSLVQVLVDNSTGEVFYELQADNLSGLPENRVRVPASEIIHDRMMPIHHPLVGVSPLRAAALAAISAQHGQEHMARFMKNSANPGGIISVPGEVEQETVDEIRTHFRDNYAGANSGRLAVLGHGLTYTQVAMSSQDSQLIEHLKWNTEQICAVFKVPVFMVLSDNPGGNSEALVQQYYNQCLQYHCNSMLECLDEGLSVPENKSVELDLLELFRGDTTTRFSNYEKGIKGGFLSVNEARSREDYPPLEGGDTVYLQQQYYALQALAERDKNSPLVEKPEPLPVDEEEDLEEQLRSMSEYIAKGFGEYNEA